MTFYTKIGKIINSPTLFAASADSRNDVLTTVAVFAGAMITYYSKFNLDGWMAMLVSVFVILNGFGLIKDTIDPILAKPRTAITSRPVRKFSAILGFSARMISWCMTTALHRLLPRSMSKWMRRWTGLEARSIIAKIQDDFLKDEGVHMSIRSTTWFP